MNLTEQDRADLEKAYGEMSDKRWNILQAELLDEEDEVEVIEIIKDVLANFEEYEKEYDFWEELKASDKTPETLEKLLEKYK